MQGEPCAKSAELPLQGLCGTGQSSSHAEALHAVPGDRAREPGAAQVTDCEEEGLEGVQSALGEYELDAADAARQNVYFTGIRIEPSSSDPAAVKAWVALLRESNPGMARALACKQSVIMP